MKDFSEETFVREISELLIKYREARSSVMKHAEHQVISLCYDHSNIMAIKYTLSTDPSLRSPSIEEELNFLRASGYL